VLDEIGGMADHTRHKDLPGAEFHVAPDFVFMFLIECGGKGIMAGPGGTNGRLDLPQVPA